MTASEKLIKQILSGRKISYKDAEKVLLRLEFELSISGSHHVFLKDGYNRTVSLKRRSELLNYQIKLMQEVLKDHGYAKEED
jgi:predicted RNA binding protein YcfA (HicA-like mRNA interferase family)